MHGQQNIQFGYFIYTRLNIKKWYILPKKFWKLMICLFIETYTTKPIRFVQVY
jgi:hypothetical protein